MAVRPRKKRGQEKISRRPRNCHRHHRGEARLTERPSIPRAHLPPEEIGGHQRANRYGRGNQQKHLRSARKPINSAAPDRSSPRGQHHQQKLETLRERLSIENVKKHRCVVMEIAGTLQDKHVVKEPGDTKDTDGEDQHEENGTAKPEDPPREVTDKKTSRPRPAREREI
jgi:hypothetical protein